MARPKKYTSSAEKQAAYRSRRAETVVDVDREALSHLHKRLADLQEAIRAAAKAGDSIAQCCRGCSADTMLDQLIMAFTDRSASASASDPEHR